MRIVKSITKTADEPEVIKYKIFEIDPHRVPDSPYIILSEDQMDQLVKNYQELKNL